MILIKFKFQLAKTSFTKPKSIGQLLNTFIVIVKKGSNVLLNKSQNAKTVHYVENTAAI